MNVPKSTLLFLLFFSLITFSVRGFSQEMNLIFAEYEQIYQQQLGSVKNCEESRLLEFRVCSEALRNDGNAPYILHHGRPMEKVIVLFHGLSDSPFYMQSIANAFHAEGYNVVVGLLPGHGKKQADADMEDPALAQRWRKQISTVMALASELGDKVLIGGFSTGGALATEYVLLHPEKVSGLLLFSGALRLDSLVETVADIWGMRWAAKLMDGDYQTAGRNPYKYPRVSTYAAFQLVDVIHSVREMMEKHQPLNLPLFVAHSQADQTTLVAGVEELIEYNQGESQFFQIPKADDVCHADLVISESQLQDMHYDMTDLGEVEPCSVPRANPLHQAMLEAAKKYLKGL